MYDQARGQVRKWTGVSSDLVNVNGPIDNRITITSRGPAPQSSVGGSRHTKTEGVNETVLHQ
ncbi:uncharacterized protein ACLA_076280 [Aspergillus clavatus NRRL 1]|uniref:Uncharacterized protein n=1 Tax=Aspergillus clavatus (strain ATCC 1007 / CBS 513.65 / DSM 816 / NCTC 3887 / NRRL 1 / QM 1276 / 107) TaxID=344612 RepID=A1C867_ASPCL|nr:uncharacterized protein ACLA_076280 [Aspergillus clavatus NRRL 1]EAW14588.1 hypothetical protein ACLA_076280 [Aspergillus clavatus NRRL 1]